MSAYVEDDSSSLHEEQDHSFLGQCYCDTRCGVILVNGMNLFLALVELGCVIVVAAHNGNETNGHSNHALMRNRFVGLYDDDTIVLAVTMLVGRMMFHVMGVLGGLHYNHCLVGTCFVGYVMQAILAAMSGWDCLATAVVFAVFAYIHLCFLKELREGLS